MLRCLYQLLTQIRDRVREDLLVILAGQVYPLGELLRASPALAARFPVVIDFPGYTADELAAIFATLAEEAGSRSPRRPRARPPPYSDRPKAVTDRATRVWPSGCWTRPSPARLAGSLRCLLPT
jgi:hypothetical protein